MIIVNAVSDIARLLDFCDKTSFANRMDASGGYEKNVTFFHGVAGKGVDDRAVGYHLLILFWGDVFFQPVEYLCVGGRGQGIPHLCLSPFFSLAKSSLIVGVYLDGEVLASIDKFDE